MFRRLAITAAALAVPLACGGDAESPRADAPPTWTARPDAEEATFDASRLLETDDGIEVMHGENATLWSGRTAEGSYRYGLTVTHLDSGMHPHGAGLTIGGRDVDGPTQSYTYFLVRGDGAFLIKTRNGDETHEIVPWTEHAAVAKEVADGTTRNALAVEVRDGGVRFFANGTEVHDVPDAATARVPTSGHLGIRLVHDIHVHFTTPTIERLAE